MNTCETSRRSALTISAAMLLAACVFDVSPAAAQSCEKLSDLKLANTAITAAQPVPAGAFTPPTGSPTPYKELPAFCRVTDVIKPTSDSDIKFEVWMPGSGWNGKFQGIGNGGFAGSISYQELAAATARGYATASTDTGHTAEPRVGRSDIPRKLLTTATAPFTK